MVKKFKDFDMDKHVVDTLNKFEDSDDIIDYAIQRSSTPVKGYPKPEQPKRIEVKGYPKKPYNAFDELVKQNKKEEEAKQKNKKNFTAKPDPSKGIIKPFDNLNPASYPVNQKEDLSMWDMMKKSARNEIKKGNYSEMQRIKDTLNDDYKRSGGQWMNDEEKKLIGKYKPKYNSEPMKFDINLDITQSRLHLEKRREEAERMKQEIDSDRKIFEKKIRRGENQGLAYLIDHKEKY
jgi:hypothetical protein